MITESNTYRQAAQRILEAITASQWLAACDVNARQLTLYYNIGHYISSNTRHGAWGTGAIEAISRMLRQQMPGLRGFSPANMRNMRLFYEAYSVDNPNLSVATDELQTIGKESIIDSIVPFLTTVAPEEFLSVSFTAHMLIVLRVKQSNNRAFYIKLCANEHLNVKSLEVAISRDEHLHRGLAANNFATAIPSPADAQRALLSFKDRYLLDFINVEQLGARDISEVDEREVENQIVHNIRNFIMTFGHDFTFVGNQYRVSHMGHDHVIDLLFFNRALSSLVAVELKTGPFKPIYLGQLSLYLQVLDDVVRKPHERPSIGLILCRDADFPYVEYVARGYGQPMAVATYRTADEMPDELRNALPDIDELKSLL